MLRMLIFYQLCQFYVYSVHENTLHAKIKHAILYDIKQSSLPEFTYLVKEHTMNITGIIAEYNPFHNGHLYHMERARIDTAADYVIVVLSGDFVQRGAPAILDKYLRTQMALENGADLVVELPVCYAASSAEYFSMGAVSLLDKLCCVNHLSFGSECGNSKELLDIASFIIEETPAYRAALNQYLRQGMHFAQANAKAVSAQFADSASIEDTLSSPNNTLGIAYLKALFKRGSQIQPHTMKRYQSGYHDTDAGALSASAVRHSMLSSAKACGQQALPLIQEDDFSAMLIYRLRSLFAEAAQTSANKNDIALCLTAYADVSEDLAFRIYTMINQYESFSQFCLLLKSKELTYSRISRALLHILLGIKKSRLDTFVQGDYISYARILGFKKESTPLFSQIKAYSKIPLISKLADAGKLLSAHSYQMLLTDIHAADLYEQTACMKYKHSFQSEYSREIIRI